jgi:hypothetical protein
MSIPWAAYLEPFRQLLDWGIILILVYAVGFLVYLFLQPITRLVGYQAALIIYATVYSVEGALFAYSKFARKKKLHKWALFAITMTHLFTAILTFSLQGWTERIWDNLFLALLSGAAWVWWKLKTEYIDPRAYTKVRGKYDPPLDLPGRKDDS